ncbi:MAG TPA: NUDIX hydrolase [Chlamydiales bacterium]|nr:NUDIX hydrolase [Chlamydiales bacterium]
MIALILLTGYLGSCGSIPNPTQFFSTEDRVLLTNPPPNFSVKAEVASILPFVNEDTVLLLQRLPTHPQANLWCAPGGKIKPGESPSFAATRELQEETGIEIDPKALTSLGKFYVRYSNGDFIFHLFKIHLNQKPTGVKIQEDEHQSYCFCSINELTTLPLTPGLDECFELALKK